MGCLTLKTNPLAAPLTGTCIDIAVGQQNQYQIAFPKWVADPKAAEQVGRPTAVALPYIPPYVYEELGRGHDYVPEYTLAAAALGTPPAAGCPYDVAAMPPRVKAAPTGIPAPGIGAHSIAIKVTTTVFPSSLPAPPAVPAVDVDAGQTYAFPDGFSDHAVGLPAAYLKSRFIYPTGITTAAVASPVVKNFKTPVTLSGMAPPALGNPTVKNFKQAILPTGKLSLAMGSVAVENTTRLAAPTGIDATVVGTPFALNINRRVYPTTADHNGIGAATVQNMRQYLYPSGADAALYGTTVVTLKNVRVYPAAIADGAVGQADIRFSTKYAYPTGLAASGYGTAAVANRNRAIYPTGSSFVGVGNPATELRLRYVYPTGLTMYGIGTPSAKTDGSLYPATVGNTAGYGEPSVQSLLKKVYPTAITAGSAGPPSIQNMRTVVVITAVAAPALGTPTTWNWRTLAYPSSVTAGATSTPVVWNFHSYARPPSIQPGDAGSPFVAYRVRYILPPSFPLTYAVGTPVSALRTLYPVGIDGLAVGASATDTVPPRPPVIRPTVFTMPAFPQPAVTKQHREVYPGGIQPVLGNEYSASSPTVRHDPPETQTVAPTSVLYPNAEPRYVLLSVNVGGHYELVETQDGWFQDAPHPFVYHSPAESQEVWPDSCGDFMNVNGVEEDLSWLADAIGTDSEGRRTPYPASVANELVVSPVCVRPVNQIRPVGFKSSTYAQPPSQIPPGLTDCEAAALLATNPPPAPVPDGKPTVELLNRTIGPLGGIEGHRQPATEAWYAANGIRQQHYVDVINSSLKSGWPLADPILEWQGMFGEWWVYGWDAFGTRLYEQVGPPVVGALEKAVGSADGMTFGSLSIRYDPGILEPAGIAPGWETSPNRLLRPVVKNSRRRQAVYQDRSTPNGAILGNPTVAGV